MEILNKTTSKQLLEALRIGNSDAFNQIYLTNRKKVSGYAYRFVRCVEEAEELTQDVFVRLWEKRSQINPDQNFEAYMYTIIRNTFLVALKRKSRLVHFKNEKQKEEYECNSVEHYLYFKECRQISDKAIQTLSPKTKMAYLLSRIEGRSHEEISKKMSISKNTVNNHIKNSLDCIRKYFENHSPETILPLFLLILCC